jgi:pre-mRNA-splicing factor ATP-dependent RNA helicase DHX15/PRP43
MQVAMKESSGKVYRTVKDEQAVMIHPSTVLRTEYDWVLYNEFVLTSKQYIRTCTGIRPEWLLVSCFIITLHPFAVRKLEVRQDADSMQEIAPVYFNLDTFEDGDIRRSLVRAAEKKRRKEAMKKAGR